MLRISVIFFVIAVIAAMFGFGEVEGVVMVITRSLFFLFFTLFILSLFVLPQRRL